MPILRFPDFNKPKLDVTGKFKVKIVAMRLVKGKSEKTLLQMTFETLKTGRQITQSWPINQYKNSLLYQNLKVMLQKEELESINTDELYSLKCRIEVTKNTAGYPEVRAIPKEILTEENTQKS